MDIKLTWHMVDEGLKKANLTRDNSIFAWHLKDCAFFPATMNRVEDYVNGWLRIYSRYKEIHGFDDHSEPIEKDFQKFKNAIAELYQ